MQNHTIRDRIAFRNSLGSLKTPAFAILDALQHLPRDIQVEALVLTATLITQGASLDPHELVSRAKRQIADADRVDNPIIEAIDAYAKGELR